MGIYKYFKEEMLIYEAKLKNIRFAYRLRLNGKKTHNRNHRLNEKR